MYCIMFLFYGHFCNVFSLKKQAKQGISGNISALITSTLKTLHNYFLTLSYLLEDFMKVFCSFAPFISKEGTDFPFMYFYKFSHIEILQL